MDCLTTPQLYYTKEQADRANEAFDQSVRQFLLHWLEQGTSSVQAPLFESDLDHFIEHGALRNFFAETNDALTQLLEQPDIARHLLRPIEQVYFNGDAYEPLLAKFEQRIYNLAVHYSYLEVSFRYSSLSRQGTHGDTIRPQETPAEPVREDIGLYFGTRRSDTTALNILARHLRQEATLATRLPIHVVTDGYMHESLLAVRTRTEQFRAEGDNQLHCFVIQRRHAVDDRHLSAALLIMDPQRPDQPQRVIFCDTLNPYGQPPWWNTFRRNLDIAFPQPAGSAPVSDRLEDGGVKLQRLHDGVPVRHQDIDCAFYTYSIVSALIRLAQTNPDLVLYGRIEAIVSQMTARMPEYYAGANLPREPEVVRYENVVRRWNTGREALRSQLPTPVMHTMQLA